jgi:hypothetical protein
MSVRKVILTLLPKSIFSKIYVNTSVATINKLIDLFRLNQKVSNFSDGQSHGEYEILNDLTNKLDINNGFVIDIAASDGYSQSCTLGFFRRAGWSGLAVEMDPIKFSSLSFLYANYPNVKLAKNRVTPNNIKSLLDAFEVPKDISVLNLDIDSYDLYVIEQMLKADYRPSIISMEVNEKIPSGIFFTVDYDDEHYWKADHFYGCSIDAASIVVKPFGYILYLSSNNYLDLTAENAYNLGYKNVVNREELFPYNADVDHWLHSNTDVSIDSIREYFKKYEGKFTLRKV